VTSAINVSDIASRYQPKANLATDNSPPAIASRHETFYASPRMPELYTQDRGNSSSSGLLGNNSAVSKYDDAALRRKHVEELEELEIREQQRQLMIKERDIQKQAWELERERARLLTATNVRTYANSNENLSDDVETHPFRQRQNYGKHTVASTPRYSYSTSHLVPPDSIQSQTSSRSQSRPVSLASTPAQSTPRTLASYSAASPVESLVRSHGNNKPKGWIRRLSMPVISSFESSKKSTGVSQPWRTSLALPEGDRDGRPGRVSLERGIYNGGSNQRIANYRG
jgi:hypothetical protein